MAAGPTQIIREQCPVATIDNDGLMSAEQAAKLASLTPGGGGTLAQSYNNGASTPDQTFLIDPAKGGPVAAQAKTPGLGSLLKALTSVGIALLDITDNAVQLIRSATPDGPTAIGTIIDTGLNLIDPNARILSVQNLTVELFGFLANGTLQVATAVIENIQFGYPHIHGTVFGGYFAVTADGIGPTWGGTGITMRNNLGASEALLTVNDVPELTAKQGRIEVNMTATKVGPPLSIVANAISPTVGINPVGAGLLKTINLPYVGFTGTLELLPTGPGAFTYDNTGNIIVALGGGTSVVGKQMFATFDGIEWWMSY